MKRGDRGFTLVELLVVIGVIAVLATIVTLGLNGYLADGRDSQRSSNITVIGEALEKYYDNNGEYPGCQAMTTASVTTLTKDILPGVSEELFKDPQDTAANSFTCDDIESTSAVNKYEYKGDGSETCLTGQACLSYVLRYKEEVSGSIVELKSRREVSISTSGVPDLAASGTGITRITANWNMVPNSTGYQLQVSSNASFSALALDETYASYSDVINNLQYNSLYYLRIRAISSTGPGAWSPTVTATTQALSAPTVTATTTGMTSLRATWGAISGATGYYVQIAKNNTFTTSLQSFNATGTSQNFTGLDYNTAYYMRVRAVVGANNGPYSAIVTRTTDDLDKPTLSASTSSLTSLDASWTTVASATAYTLEVSTVSSFSTITRTINTTTATTASVTGLSYNTIYYLRVKGTWSGNQGPWSNVVSRSTDVLDAPLNLTASMVSASQINTEWDSVPGATSYRLEWSTSSAFASVTGVDGITGTSRAATGLSAATTYYFRVRAVWSGNGGQWSDTANARTDIGAPTGSTITAAMSGTNAIGTASATCGAGSAQYQIRTRNTNTSTMGTWSSWSAWGTAVTRSVAGAQGYQYGFQMQSRCVSGTSISDTVSPTTVATTVRPFAAPGAPSVSASTSGATTNFARGAVTCSGNGTPQYQYRWSQENTYYSYAATTAGSVNINTSSQGYNYGANWSARCSNMYNTGPYGGEGRATYLRPVNGPGPFSYNIYRESSHIIRASVTSSCGSGAWLYGIGDMHTWDWPWTGAQGHTYGWRRNSYGWSQPNYSYYTWTMNTGATTGNANGIPGGSRWNVAGQLMCMNPNTGRNSGSYVYGESGAYTM